MKSRLCSDVRETDRICLGVVERVLTLRQDLNLQTGFDHGLQSVGFDQLVQRFSLALVCDVSVNRVQEAEDFFGSLESRLPFQAFTKT